MCTSFNFSLFSHPNQLLVDHLHGVTDIALNLYKNSVKSANPEFCDALFKICMAHDFGKATSFFQDYMLAIKLKTNKTFGIEKSHALVSALFAYWWVPEKYKMLAYLTIKRHHGSIDDFANESISEDDLLLIRKQVNNIYNFSKNEIEQIYGIDLKEFVNFIDNDDDEIDDFFFNIGKKSNLDNMFLLNEIYSYLLSGDKLQLINVVPEVPSMPNQLSVETYKNMVREAYITKNSNIEQSNIFNFREAMFNELKYELAKIDIEKESFFSINVPTGAGKTFLAYYAGMFLANKIGMNSRIVYALPYMSIVDQNHSILENILKYEYKRDLYDSELLRHHSLSEIKYNDGDSIFKERDLRFIYDNWQSRIITTTFVQLCNTIFKVGNKNIAHRFNKLANAVIILDEIQVLPDKLHTAFCKFMSVLAKNYNTKFIFVTATMPILNPARELIPNKVEYFNNLNRIVINNRSNEELTLEEFLNIVHLDVKSRSEKSFLIVLNTIKSAKKTYEYLKNIEGREIIYLTTEIYPKARLEIIHSLKEKMEKGLKPILVSTQLIEAGVDIDFDIVYRDFAPLSSINQTAGRANRNGIGVDIGEVNLYKLYDSENGYRYHSIYEMYAIMATNKVLKGKVSIPESEIFELSKKYAAEVVRVISPDASNDIVNFAEKFKFKSLREVTDIIDKDEVGKHEIIIEADDACRELLKSFKEFSMIEDKFIRYDKLVNLYRKLELYKISVYDKVYNKISGDLQKIEGFDVEYLQLKSDDGRCLYSEKEGLNTNSAYCNMIV